MEGITEEAVLLLCSLLCLQQAQRQTVSAGGIPMLCRVLQVGTPTAVECSVAGLVMLAKANPEWCTAIDREGITPCLTSMGTNPQYSERAQAKVRPLTPRCVVAIKLYLRAQRCAPANSWWLGVDALAFFSSRVCLSMTIISVWQNATSLPSAELTV